MRLAHDGAAVAVNGLASEQVQAVVDRSTAAGGRAVAALGDVSSPEEVAAMVAVVDRELVGLHILVNTAGIQM